MGGHAADHDRLVAATVEALCQTADVIVLAQASMSRVADSLPTRRERPPILTSPPLAVEYLATVLGPGCPR